MDIAERKGNALRTREKERDLWSLRDASVTNLGEARQTTWGGTGHGTVGTRPESSIPHARASWITRKVTSGLWDTPRVTPESIRHGHVARTRERIGQEMDLIMVMQDSTSLHDCTHPATTSLGLLPGAKIAGTSPSFGAGSPRPGSAMGTPASRRLGTATRRARHGSDPGGERRKEESHANPRRERAIVDGRPVCTPWRRPCHPANGCWW
jgi:hypothetical protein